MYADHSRLAHYMALLVDLYHVCIVAWPGADITEVLALMFPPAVGITPARHFQVVIS